jgi:hypothetical protein
MATVMWVCPVGGCPVRQDRPGSCSADLVQLVLEESAPEPEPEPEAAAPATLAIDCPWGQIVDIPAAGLAIGRSVPAFHGGGIERYDQVSRLHARLYWADGRLLVDDTDSANGTFVNGVRVEPGEPMALGAGQELRLAEDVPCKIVQLNEFGEPM